MDATQTPHAPGSPWWPRLAGAALCLAVAAVHVIDQGGFPGSKEPVYVGIGYYVVEAAGVVTAALLVAGAVRVGWFLAMGVGAGPFIGYVLSRGTGLPGYTDDIGNWAEPVGVASLVVEGLLFLLALTMFLRSTVHVRQAAARASARAPADDEAGHNDLKSTAHCVTVVDRTPAATADLLGSLRGHPREHQRRPDDDAEEASCTVAASQGCIVSCSQGAVAQLAARRAYTS